MANTPGSFSWVHGILHTHARQADAVRAFIEECRYPFHKEGREGLGEGQRGAGGQGQPAEIWGVHLNVHRDCRPFGP
ncbi:MAG: hypothetical protein CM1200mP39_27090 [Dehalococcoidia bacterium]|nr:MAG: hypothetical protein CM1200mP39_27090 [Dehalococcoidia bacterium]